MADFEILYEDDWLLLVNKPSGLPSQASPKVPMGLFEKLKSQYDYVGLHHRLDQPASGVLLFSIHPSVNEALSRGFQNKTIRRVYQAILAGNVEDTLWSQPISGKEARTLVTRLGHANGMSSAELQLETGRKHQIRLHATEARHPIVGDRRYGQQWGKAWPRLALHAKEIQLKHPQTGNQIVVRAPLPEDISELWALAGGP